jgi:hypothetical protein
VCNSVVCVGGGGETGKWAVITTGGRTEASRVGGPTNASHLFVVVQLARLLRVGQLNSLPNLMLLLLRELAPCLGGGGRQ